MKDVKLLADKFDGLGNQLVRLVVAVDPEHARHEQKETVVAENGLEIGCRNVHIHPLWNCGFENIPTTLFQSSDKT